MQGTVPFAQQRRLRASARDVALRRLRSVKRFVVVGALALAAGFTVLAYGATPPYQKQRHTAVVAAASGVQPATARIHSAHHRRHRRHHHAVSAAAPATPSSPAPAAAPTAPPAASAPTPAPAAPAPQAPAAAPAPTQQPPAATSGGS